MIGRHIGLSERELLDYLPNYDPNHDSQVGEWVMVCSYRRAALIDPLINMWEQGRQAKKGHAVPVQYTLQQVFELFPRRDQGTVERATVATDTSVQFPMLVPLSKAKSILCERKRRRRGEQERGETSSSESLQEPLYLNFLCGLLTPTAPPAFGGHGIVDMLTVSPGSSEPRRLLLDTFSSAVYDPECLPPGGIPTPKSFEEPPWLAETEKTAHEELVQWGVPQQLEADNYILSDLDASSLRCESDSDQDASPGDDIDYPLL